MTQSGCIALVGEAYGAEEERLGRPFVGPSGYELDQQLAQAGISRGDCFVTNVTNTRPPANEIKAWFARKSEFKREGLAEIAGRYPRQPILDGLRALQVDLAAHQPRLIIALGDTALWALTGETGIMKWRGSILQTGGGPIRHQLQPIKVIPTVHPAAVLREMPLRALAIADLKRAAYEATFSEVRRPQWSFTIPRSAQEVREWFSDHCWRDVIVADVENVIGTGELICLGFAYSPTEAICIPFMHRTGNNPHYWSTPEEECEVALLCREVLTRRPVAFHNGLHDCQIIAKQWGFMPRFEHDTMVAQHVAYPGLLGGKIDPITGRVSKKGSSLSLSFCSSMYCRYHRFWKDDGRGWDPAIHDEEQYWHYNCEDTVRTYEVHNALQSILAKRNLLTQYRSEMQLFGPVFEMMFRGMRFDDERRKEFRREVDAEHIETQRWIDTAVGHPLNCSSTPQMRALFYDDFRLPPILHRKTKQPTLDDHALELISKRKPVLRPLIERIQHLRSLDVYQENFLDVKLAADSRLHVAMNIAGAETMRFSSNTNAFGEGFNGQNLPRD